MSKKKPSKRLGHIVTRLQEKEARASVSLDGSTQSCDLCTLELTAGPHRCGKRYITEAERELCEAARGEDLGRYAEALDKLRKNK